MQFSDIKTRGWWAIDDVAQAEISDTIMGQLINEGLKELGPYLNTIKSATPIFAAGVATLPTDFVSPIAVYDDDTLLSEITDITDKVEDTDTTSQYFIPNATQIQIYGITPTGTVKLWYKASPAALSNATDVPGNVPEQFHASIAEVFVKAKYALKNNRLGEYSGLMQLWEQIKREVFAATNADRHASSNAIKDAY